MPLYGDLLELVAETNRQVLREDAALAHQLQITGEIERLAMEPRRHPGRHRGRAGHLRRLFRVMGMAPVGYYDLSVAGVPVHSTAFRAVHEDALQISPFRVFTSPAAPGTDRRSRAACAGRAVCWRRRIFTDRAWS